MPTSQPVSRASILNQFITDVKNLSMMPLATYHTANSPVGAHQSLGPRTEPNPTWPTNVGEITTSNVFYILHGFALKLTRHRQARFWRRRSVGSTVYDPEDLGFFLTAYRENSVVWFDYPTIPDVGTPMNAATLTTYLNTLRTQVANIKTNTAYASDILGCHNSAPGGCHGSRGRR